MLEETLKSINLNLERIANSLEQKEQLHISQTPDNIFIGEMPVFNQPKTEVSEPQPTIQNLVKNTVPTTVAVENFTQEQIAKAMATAMDAGKMDVIKKILSTFNAQSLMDVEASNYGKIASILREDGIQI